MSDAGEANSLVLRRLAEQAPQRNILVTGASGFIGGHFTFFKLFGAGHVACVVRAPDDARAAERLRSVLDRCAEAYAVAPHLPEARARLSVFAGDVTRPDLGLGPAALQALGELAITEIWHLAATLMFEQRRRDEIFETNVGGTGHAIELARRLGARRFVYVSTAYTAGTVAGDVAEELHPTAGPFNNAYEESKCQAEHQVVARCREAGLEAILLRPSIVMGPTGTYRSGGSSSGVYGFMRRLTKLKPTLDGIDRAVTLVADPDARVNLIPVNAVVRDMLAVAAEASPRPIYHLTATRAPTVGGAFELICKEVGIANLKLQREPPAQLSPLEEMLRRYVKFYGSYMSQQKTFARSLPFDAGVGLGDLRSYFTVYAHELRQGDADVFHRETVRAADGTALCAYWCGNADGPPLVLANAYAMPAEFWAPIAAALAPEFRIITWETRGLPNLVEPFDPARTAPRHHAEDLAAVLDHFGIGAAHVAGWCSGAQVALSFAEVKPARARSLIFLNGSFCLGPEVPRTEFTWKMLRLMPLVAGDRRRASLYCRMIYGEGEAHAGAGEARAGAGDSGTLLDILSNVDPFVLHMTSAPFRSGESLYRYANMTMGLFAGTELTGPLALDVPALLIAGGRDTIAHAQASTAIAARLARARLLELEDADHYALYKDSRIPELMREFLRAQS